MIKPITCGRLSFRIAATVATAAALCHTSGNSARGAPGIRELELSTDPLLVEARKFDLSFQPPEKANQQKAEDLYLQFAGENPNSPLVPYLFYHLGQMYTSKVDSSVWKDKEKKYPHVRDDKKAGEFFAESVRRHPPNKISALLVDARVCAAALAPTRDERLQQYIDYYRWLDGMKKEDLLDNFWFSDGEKQVMKRWSPEHLDGLMKAFWHNRKTAMDVAAINMLAVAKGGQDRRDVLKRLDKIMKDIPGKEPAKLAEAAKAELSMKPSRSPGR